MMSYKNSKKMLREKKKLKNARTAPVCDLLRFSLPKRKRQTKIIFKKFFQKFFNEKFWP